MVLYLGTGFMVLYLGTDSYNTVYLNYKRQPPILFTLILKINDLDVSLILKIFFTLHLHVSLFNLYFKMAQAQQTQVKSHKRIEQN